MKLWRIKEVDAGKFKGKKIEDKRILDSIYFFKTTPKPLSEHFLINYS